MCINISQTPEAVERFSKVSEIPFRKEYDLSKFSTHVTAGRQRLFVAASLTDPGETKPRPYLVRSNWGISIDDLFLCDSRFESLKTKSIWQESVSRQRVLVPTNGYYADQHFIHPGEDKNVTLAGITIRWNSHHAIMILTRPASRELSSVLDRTPVVVPATMWHEWLDETMPFDTFVPLGSAPMHLVMS